MPPWNVLDKRKDSSCPPEGIRLPIRPPTAFPFAFFNSFRYDPAIPFLPLGESRMPRADQPIRQWTILKLLESNGRVTLRQIADALSESCHERTLRRDLDVLGLVGFPIYAERENGKTVWKLDDAYRCAPLPLTATELYALQCGMQMMAPLEGTFLTDAIQSIYQKIKANLPTKSKEYLALLQQTIQIGMPPYKIYKAHRSRIDPIQRAIETGKTIELRYAPLRTGRAATRAVNPYRLWHYGGMLYLIGYCHGRKDVRTFAIDRIASIQVTDRSFQVPFYFSIDDYFKDAFGVYRGEAEAVSLRFEKRRPSGFENGRGIRVRRSRCFGAGRFNSILWLRLRRS